MQPYYGIDLSKVTYAEGINTGHGRALAYCDRIFFTKPGNLWLDKSELHLTLHEIEHLVQCQQRGRRTFLVEYILKAGMDAMKSRQVDVHDMIDMERAAEAKAARLTNIVWDKIQKMRHMAPVAVPMRCMQGEVFMPTAGGACCTPNYSQCRNLTTGHVTCRQAGCQ